MKLEINEPVEICKVKVGVFSFTTPEGKDDTGDFYVSCEGVSPDLEIRARNLEVYNTQLTDEWIRLEASGYTNIKYLEDEPFAF